MLGSTRASQCVVSPALPSSQKRNGLSADREVALDLGDAWRRPSGVLRFLPLDPGSNASPEGYLAPVCFDPDAVGIDFCITPKRVLDLAFDVGRRYLRLQLDQVDHTTDPAEVPDGAFGRLALVIPFCGAF